MPPIELALHFIERAKTISSPQELASLLEATTLEMGFQYFALVHHVDLRADAPQAMRMHNYPDQWSEYFITNGLYAEDPIHVASLLSNVGFTWEEVPNKIRLTSRQRKIIEMAGRHGLRNGFTVPGNVPGESTGSCSFATAGGLELPAENLPLAYLIGGFAFEAARRLRASDAGSTPPEPLRLTPRQHDCLLLVIHGYTDKEIARELDISAQTVKEYLNHLRRRYGVKNRLVLAVRAIYDGQISFIEAFADKPPLWRG